MYVREFDGEERNFGVIGLDEGTLIMYDAESRSWWSQLFGEAVKGTMTGEQLVKLPSTMTTWGKWRALHPETTVYVKPSVPYNAVFTAETFANIAQSPEGPLQGNDWVIGVEGHVEAKAYLARALAVTKVLNDELDGAPIVVFLSDDLATARILLSTVRDNALTFTRAANDKLRDEQTGSLWDPLSGTAISGPMQGEILQPLVSTYSLWFAWEKYRPDTVVWGASE